METVMTKVHFPRNLSTYRKVAANGNLMMLLAQPTVCGQRPNRRPNVEITTTPADVDCAKCRAALPEPTINAKDAAAMVASTARDLSVEEQMRTAYAAGDLDEVIRLAKTIT